MSAERWLPIPGWHGFYEVSDQGRVRSVARVVPRASTPQLVRERVLKSPPASHGYPRVNLCHEGKYVQRTVHSLVLEAFVGPRPHGMEILHGNGVCTDARLANLRYGTSAENKADTVRHETAWWLKRAVVGDAELDRIAEMLT